MGKGDRKTAKGKRNISSYGNARSAGVTKVAGTGTPAAVKAKPKAPVVAKKAPAKKAAK